MVATTETSASADPEERGSSLIHPLAESAQLRRRRERPAELGRYPLALLGVVCAASASALWLFQHVSVLSVALLAFGLLLIALGATLHLVLLRDRERWPEEAHAWEEGIEILLHDGDLKAALWDDPKLALDVFVRDRKGSAEPERVLCWRMDRAIPPCDLTQEGFDRLMQIVASRDLGLREYRSGRPGREARAYEIRPRSFRLQLEKASARIDPTRSAP
jgi:hypothetical protein